MIILGFVLLVIGLFVSSILFWLGVALIVLGLVLNFALPAGPTGVRRRYW